MYVGIEEVHLIHHSHTDVGYTHDQPVVWELHQRFLERAIALCKEWEGSQEPQPCDGRWRTPACCCGGWRGHPTRRWGSCCGWWRRATSR